MFATLKLKLAILANKFRRRQGPSLADRCAEVIMRVCSLQLDRTESRELAPTSGATGPMLLSGGAITTITYKVFDTDADKVDKAIRQEPWRAFADVIMRISIESDPEFSVSISADGAGLMKSVEPKAIHKAPGLALISHLSKYFPLLPKPYTGNVYAPVLEAK